MHAYMTFSWILQLGQSSRVPVSIREGLFCRIPRTCPLFRRSRDALEAQEMVFPFLWNAPSSYAFRNIIKGITKRQSISLSRRKLSGVVYLFSGRYVLTNLTLYGVSMVFIQGLYMYLPLEKHLNGLHHGIGSGESSGEWNAVLERALSD